MRGPICRKPARQISAFDQTDQGPLFSGRVEPEYVMEAFAQGADGVLIGGCHFGDCHYKTGNHKTSQTDEDLFQNA
jgi:hypothetical protein